MPKTKRIPKNYQNWETPPEAVAPLLPYLPKRKTIWEPCCGSGRLVKALRESGREVVGTNEVFFERALFGDIPDGCKLIVTNPPWVEMTWFLFAAYESGLPFAMLLPLRVLEHCKRRQEKWRRHGVQLLFLPQRIHYIFPETGERHKKTNFDSVWVCHRLLPSSLVISD